MEFIHAKTTDARAMRHARRNAGAAVPAAEMVSVESVFDESVTVAVAAYHMQPLETESEHAVSGSVKKAMVWAVDPSACVVVAVASHAQLLFVLSAHPVLFVPPQAKEVSSGTVGGFSSVEMSSFQAWTSASERSAHD